MLVGVTDSCQEALTVAEEVCLVPLGNLVLQVLLQGSDAAVQNVLLSPAHTLCSDNAAWHSAR